MCFSHLLPYQLYTSPESILVYWSQVWGGAPKSTLCLLNNVQSKAIRLINNPDLTTSLQPLFQCHLVGDLATFYGYFLRYWSQEIRDIILVPLRRVRTTRSSTHSHPFQVSLPTPRILSHKPAICGNFCFPKCYNLPFSNLRSINLILPVSLASLSPSFIHCSIVGALYRPLWPFLNITHKKIFIYIFVYACL